jgi:hypothetical protein
MNPYLPLRGCVCKKTFSSLKKTILNMCSVPEARPDLTSFWAGDLRGTPAQALEIMSDDLEIDITKVGSLKLLSHCLFCFTFPPLA